MAAYTPPEGFRRPSNSERPLVHTILRLRSYGDAESLRRAQGLQDALDQTAKAFGSKRADCSDAAMAWPERPFA